MTARRTRRRLVLADDGIIDLIAVEIATRRARTVSLTRAERQLAAARILARGGTAYVISKRLHVSGTTTLMLAARCQGVPVMTRRTQATADAMRIPGQWAERVLCAQADPDVWYPEHHALIARAKRICAACPVRAECLEYALSGAGTWRGITTGIWGGTTPRERSRLRQARKAAAA
jgi:WhiB family transcriptional regulator, redox-sensing transcriptional regulator